MKIRQTEQIPPVSIRSPSTYAAVPTPPSSPYHLPPICGRRGSKSRRCSVVPPPLWAAQRDNATPPRLGVRHATMETERPCGGEMLSKHGGLSANVSVKRVGDELRPVGKNTQQIYTQAFYPRPFR